jgi:hypothetical protein
MQHVLPLYIGVLLISRPSPYILISLIAAHFRPPALRVSIQFSCKDPKYEAQQQHDDDHVLVCYAFWIPSNACTMEVLLNLYMREIRVSIILVIIEEMMMSTEIPQVVLISYWMPGGGLSSTPLPILRRH